LSNIRSSQEQTEAVEENPSLQDFDRLIDIQLLYLIDQEAMSGYDLRRIMQRRFHVTLSYGTIYPHLKNFEKKKLAMGTWGHRADKHSKKKVYAMTEKGRSTLRKCLSDLAKMNDELSVKS
jgi:DNA-binding PadR family transcriptional regulator